MSSKSTSTDTRAMAMSSNRIIEAIVHNKKVILVALAVLALTNVQQRQLRSYLRGDDISYTVLSNGIDIDSAQSKEGLQHNNNINKDVLQSSSIVVFPSWAIATQCSMFHTDCPNHLHFQEYPFPLQQQQQHDDDHHSRVVQSSSTNNITIKAKEWIRQLKTHNNNSSNTSNKNHHYSNLTSYIYPPKVSPSTQQTCLTSTHHLPIETQLDHLLPQLTPLQSTHNMIAFSMTDITYATTMLHEVYEMNNDIVGFDNAFFFVAMDSLTATMACEYGYPVIAVMPPNNDNNNNNSTQHDDLKKQVQTTKVLISKLLVERHQPFLFYEMDVWFIRSPLPLLQREMSHYDFVCSTHQWNPSELNIGFYAALANNGTCNYFRDSMKIMESNPLAHDQKVMHIVANDNTATLTLENPGCESE